MRLVGAVEDPRSRTARAWVLDVVVVLVVVALACPYLLRSAPEPRWLAVTAVACMVLPLVARQIWPVSVLAAVLAAAVGFGIWDVRLAGSMALPVALYSVAARGTRRQAYFGAVALEILIIAAAVRLSGAGLLLPVVFFTGMVAAAVGLGLYSAVRRAYVQELLDRTERLEREQEQTNALAVAAERARISREMHDIVAHHLTVMVAVSDAATRLVRADVEQAIGAMRTVSATGRDALRDTRRLLGVLQDDQPESDRWHPIPAVRDLDALVDQVRTAGLTVDLRIQGGPVTMPLDTQLAVYRLVQEALTNTMKHAPSHASATVTLSFGQDTLDLRVEDDGAGQPAPANWRPGRGMSGMRARIEAARGELDSGPREPTGWQLEARLPLRDDAVAVPDRPRR
ncbi:integral membrane sensor signal transduction histidine kinase [Parafrankia sp. EAN1pec]|uniref:sensor histidine kinase n=1 Tax=Parafrankia sp. (strain EAN1pec) TaxID=298653 RepID=UPI00005430F4|nr:integral membrane sensor signal transduction histidine kinase [Frankia sp. EAN1pec]